MIDMGHSHKLRHMWLSDSLAEKLEFTPSILRGVFHECRRADVHNPRLADRVLVGNQVGLDALSCFGMRSRVSIKVRLVRSSMAEKNGYA
jgi:hypothetical protein